MTSPFMRSRHALSKQITIWTELPEHINLASSVSLDLNVLELLISFGKYKAALDNSDFCFIILMYSSIGK